MPSPDDSGGAPARNSGIDIRSPTAIFDDERAIEGLPIRLVIALLVGVAALSVMMTMIDDVGGVGKTELDAEPEPDTIDVSEDAKRDVTITVVDQNGETVSGATVVLQGSSARLSDGTQHAESGSDGTATFDGITPELEDNQDQGTLEISLQHPDSQFKDDRENAEILVLS
ncbi:carboxypeptidase-like regulatory domain-containing protein [Salinarchaeum laminariae]|uniref:carboxypeptidase-like regulatory domain-containing protein n=1 Tax=Salinarchaeum laminariae TaxID=869888 RepID=UPI0020BE9C8A|nr:carboxypeptidase-like regulatory domain-containing protein [Salinarchaeum laminariae]